MMTKMRLGFFDESLVISPKKVFSLDTKKKKKK